MPTVSPLPAPEARATARDGVSFTVRAYGPDAVRVMLPLLDISPHGLMAACDRYRPGEWLRLLLPGEGVTAAEIRWRDGDRIGCRFDRAIDPAGYYTLLAEMLRPHDPGSGLEPNPT